jgi:hypothetical protein
MYVAVYGQLSVTVRYFWQPSLTLLCILFVWSTADNLNYRICFILVFECNGHSKDRINPSNKELLLKLASVAVRLYCFVYENSYCAGWKVRPK